MGLKILDLFSGAGGASAGYLRAGADEVTDVDLFPQPDNPHPFVRADWKVYLEAHWMHYDFIHASPVCKGYANVSTRVKSSWDREIPLVRAALEATGKPYVIENVGSAVWDMKEPIRLCGSSFGLRVRRHRFFESNLPIVGKDCDHGWQDADKIYLRRGRYSKPTRSGVCPVNGDGMQLLGVTAEEELRLRREAMGIDWMSWKPLTQAIPPAYTEYIGKQVISLLQNGTSCE